MAMATKQCTVVAALLLSLLALVPCDGHGSCPYLDGAVPVEMELPVSALSSSLQDLSLKFVGVKPIVKRKRVPAGGKPKVIVHKYSSKPVIDYDDITGAVTIATAGCSDEGDSAATTSTSSTAGLLTTAAAAIALAATRNRADVAIAGAAAAAFYAIPSVRAGDTCEDTVEVLVEAPNAYLGAVETCNAEVFVPGQCPEPFPAFPTCSQVPAECPVAVVGAGVGGLYTAMRLVDEGKVQASDVCIFEMTERVGGRLFSLRGFGPNKDLSVDAGGYRTWPEFTPTTHALITEYLGIPMGCYDPTEEPCTRFNIVDDEGKKDGFATFVEAMMQRLVDGGACFFPYHELDSISQVPSSSVASGRQQNQFAPDFERMTMLHFTNGVETTATYTTLLGIPQRPLLSVLRNSDLPTSVLNGPKLDALHSVQTAIVTKLYLYYPRGSVFWRRLGLDAGDFELDGDARNMLLQGRYHDGHVECDDPNDATTCHGFLLAVYANDLSGNKAQYFRRYQRDRPEPITILSNSDLEGAQFLAHAHSRMEEYHLYENNENRNYTGFEATQVFSQTQPPEFAVLSTWNVAVPWAGGGWHLWTDLSDMELSMKPFADNNIFVVNEAYSLLQGWAEGAIKLGDEILSEYFGVQRPWSFPVVDLNQVVSQTNSRECVEVEEETTTGGDDGSGASDGDTGSVLCFTRDAMVLMADGTRKAIADVQEGDYVDTGTGSGEGLVTEALVHPVGRTVPVAVVHTEQGDLVGTPDHPVLVDGQWVELSAVQLHDDFVMTLEEQHVDVFYNLEIDGHVLDESSHSYVVNGVVASGLGDNEILNTKYPRQEVWKETVEAMA